MDVKYFIIQDKYFQNHIYRVEYLLNQGYDNFYVQSGLNNSKYILHNDFYPVTETTPHIIYTKQNYSNLFSLSSNGCISVDTKPIYKMFSYDTIKIYHPGNQIDTDAIVLVSTNISYKVDGILKTEYLQLYCGVYSECEYNSENTIKDNLNTYSEYSLIKIPNLSDLLTKLDIQLIDYNLSFDISLVPYSVYNTDTLYFDLNSDYIPDTFSFTRDNKLLVKANLGFLLDENENETGDYGITLLPYFLNDDFSLNNYIKIYGGVYDDNYTKPNKFTVFITLCSNYIFSEENLLWYKKVEVPIEELMNYKVSFVGIFDGLEAVPDSIIGRVTISDSVYNVSIYSNYFAILRDDIKWILNRPVLKQINVTSLINKENDMKITNIVENPENIKLNTNISTPKVIYKPIFFKVQELNKVSLISSITQRIAINLQDYQTKVSAFYIKIGDYMIKESERNSVFVIFKVDATKITDLTLTSYHILDQDSEYITSGVLSIV